MGLRIWMRIDTSVFVYLVTCIPIYIKKENHKVALSRSYPYLGRIATL